MILAHSPVTIARKSPRQELKTAGHMAFLVKKLEAMVEHLLFPLVLSGPVREGHCPQLHKVMPHKHAQRPISKVVVDSVRLLTNIKPGSKCVDL